MVKEKILVENIPITLYRKSIKNVYLRITPPEGEVKLSVPHIMSNNDIINFIKTNKDWILLKQKEILENNIKAPLKYRNGETHTIWGKEYTCS